MQSGADDKKTNYLPAHHNQHHVQETKWGGETGGDWFIDGVNMQSDVITPHSGAMHTPGSIPE